jgi:hypothetical protein
MSDYVEWNPKRHGQKPPYWLPDMLTSVDGKNFARQPNWAWIAGSTYYVPREAVELPRIEPEPAQLAADRIEAQAAEIERLRKALRFYTTDYANPNEGPWGVDSKDFGNVARAALEKQP